MGRAKDLFRKLHYCVQRMSSEYREVRVHEMVSVMQHLEELQAFVSELESKVFDAGVGKAMNQARIAKAMSHAYWTAHVKNTSPSLPQLDSYKLAELMADKHWEDWMDAAKHWMQIRL
jgi:hypothetical protein